MLEGLECQFYRIQPNDSIAKAAKYTYLLFLNCYTQHLNTMIGWSPNSLSSSEYQKRYYTSTT